MAKRSGGKSQGSTLTAGGVSGQGRARDAGAQARKADDGWVTLRQASDDTGVSISTLRSWYRKGLIDSRVEKGPNGSQRIVRLQEVAARARPATRPAGTGDGLPDRNARAGELRQVIEELAAARERAGRAEARADLLAQELSELRERAANGGGEHVATLEAENRMLRERLELMRGQAEEMARRLSAFDGPPEEIDLTDDGEPAIPPPEEDEYLALAQRWRARRMRRKVARKNARREARAKARADR